MGTPQRRVAGDRFAIFAGSKWYPNRGLGDLHSTWSSVDEAIVNLPKPSEVTRGWGCAWAHLVDVHQFTVVQMYAEAPGNDKRVDSWVETDDEYA